MKPARSFDARAVLTAFVFYLFLTMPKGVLAQTLDGDFVFMNGCKNEACLTAQQQNCYLTDPVCASKAVANLRAAGIKHFLLPSAADSLAKIRPLATAIDAAGLDFYVYEGWAWGDGPSASCDNYASRIDSVLIPLRAEFPNAFAGVQFKDEPLPGALDNLKRHAACVRSKPMLAGLRIFLDLLPLDSNQLSAVPAQTADFLSPQQYGVDCAAGGITDTAKAVAQVARFSDYVIAAANDVQPDYLATNIYAFHTLYASCPAAREFVMSEGLSLLSAAANLRGIVPVAHTQNVESKDPGGFFAYTSFHRLRWYASWFYAFGGKGFSDFISNDYARGGGRDLRGILDDHNDATHLASDTQSAYGFTSPLRAELSKYRYRGFVAPFLSVNEGSIVGWLPSTNVLIGEYGTNDDHEAVLFFARRHPDQPTSIAHGQIGLKRWWSKVEKFDYSPTSGWSWQIVGTSTNTLSVELDTFPGALYRLTR